MNDDRERLITRARAIWARTSSDHPSEAEAARNVLKRFMERFNLDISDLGPAPAKDVDPEAQSKPETSVDQYKEWARHFNETGGIKSTSEPPPEYTGDLDHWREWVKTVQEEAAANVHFDADGRFYSDVPTGPGSPFEGFKVVRNFGANPETISIPRIDMRRFGDRIDQGGIYVLHQFPNWQGITGVVGHAPYATHIWVGLQGNKWEDLLRLASDYTLPDWRERIDLEPPLRLHDELPYVTERPGDLDSDWVEINEEDFDAMKVMNPQAINFFLRNVIGAARQYEATYHLH